MARNSLNEGTLYPGVYTPGEGMERRMAIFRSSKKKAGISADVQLKEEPSSYCIEINLAGVRRDELLLFAEDNVLTIDVLNDDQKEKKIKLPTDADLEFVSAELRKGILKVHIPRALTRVRKLRKEIIVY